jgi:signal transduction histidine kinase
MDLAELLEMEGFEVISAEDGGAGIQMARQYLPSLIICDVMMPELDGHAVLAELRQDPATATIPFIFLTARAEKTDLRKGMELGADDYLTKPFTRDELLKAISTRLSKQAAVTREIQTKLDDLRGSITLSLPHEMRTPLTGIIGYSEILAEDYASIQPEEIREFAQAIQQSARRLQHLILNYVLYAELEVAVRDAAYARALLGHGSSDIRSVATDVAIQQAQQAQREADLSVELGEGTVQVVERFTRRVIEELLNNAFKFSQPGTPVLVTGQSDGHSYTLCVQDRGRGMTTQQIADVGAYLQFERQRHEQQGQGLGLAIAKRLTELHDGKLSIQSEYGRQTTVCIILPVEHK